MKKTGIFRRDLHVYKTGTVGRAVERKTGTPLAFVIFFLLAVIVFATFILGLLIGIAL